MDAFFAAIEQRDNPEYRGKPVLVGGGSTRGVVAAASYEAREFGIHSAMPSVEARRRCPHAIFVRGRMSVYATESKRIFEIFRRYSPLVEGLSLDEAFIDLTGTEKLLGHPETAAANLRAEVRRETDLAVSTGIAPVKMVAKIASDLAKPDGMLSVRSERVRPFLAPPPVGRICGVGPVARTRLERIGVATIGDLARTSDSALEAALGNWGPAAARLARGEDTREVESYREAKSYGEENTFSEDIADRGRLVTAIRAHSEAVARRLRRDEVRGRTITLKLKLARRLGAGKFPLLSRSTTLGEATDDGAQIAAVARELLTRSGLSEPVRLLGVSLSQLEPRGVEQLGLFETPGRSRRKLNHVVDEIQDRFGRTALERGIAPVGRAGLSLQIKRGDD